LFKTVGDLQHSGLSVLLGLLRRDRMGSLHGLNAQ
jgi:hypothetical protein